MAIKAYVTISVEKEQNTYTFLMPVGAPFGQAYDAAFEVVKQISQMAQQSLESSRSQTPSTDVQEPSNEC